MKKHLVAGLAALLLVAIVAANLWLELRTERVRSTDLLARAAALETVQSAPAVAAPALETVVAPAATASQVTTAPQVTAAQARPVATAEPVIPPPTAREDAPKAPVAAMMEAMQSPQGLDFTRSMMRGVMAQMYPDVEAELDLTPEEAQALFDLLVKQQEELSAESMGMLTGGARDPDAMREMQRKLVEGTRAHEQELAAMLGSKYPKWEEYQSTAAARQQVQQLRTTLAATGNPLSEAQSTSLVAAFAAEQARSQKQERDWMVSGAAMQSPNLVQESMQRAVESQRKLVGVATPHLTSAQADQFKQQVEQQASMLLATMGLMGGQGGTP